MMGGKIGVECDCVPVSAFKHGFMIWCKAKWENNSRSHFAGTGFLAVCLNGIINYYWNYMSECEV